MNEIEPNNTKPQDILFALHDIGEVIEVRATLEAGTGTSSVGWFHFPTVDEQERPLLFAVRVRALDANADFEPKFSEEIRDEFFGSLGSLEVNYAERELFIADFASSIQMSDRRDSQRTRALFAANRTSRIRRKSS